MSVENLIELYKKSKESFQKEFSLAIHGELNPLFSKYPDLKSVGFKAYTPYFNDGEVCEYRLCIDEESLLLNGEQVWDIEENISWAEEASVEFSDLFYKIPSYIFEYVYEEGLITFFSDGSVTIDEDIYHE